MEKCKGLQSLQWTPDDLGLWLHRPSSKRTPVPKFIMALSKDNDPCLI